MFRTPASNVARAMSVLTRAMSTPWLKPGMAPGPAMRLYSTPKPCSSGWRISIWNEVCQSDGNCTVGLLRSRSYDVELLTESTVPSAVVLLNVVSNCAMSCDNSVGMDKASMG